MFSNVTLSLYWKVVPVSELKAATIGWASLLALILMIAAIGILVFA
ncbi:MAG: hypothetical protein P4M09_02280 [Devosia sp.]|nr:hypothetical protein [Devosia sp.]